VVRNDAVRHVNARRVVLADLQIASYERTRVQDCALLLLAGNMHHS
jgi:hypothetical protein